MFFHHVVLVAVALLPHVVTAHTFSVDSSNARHSTDSLRVIQANQVVVTGTRNEIRLKDSPVRVEVVGKE